MNFRLEGLESVLQLQLLSLTQFADISKTHHHRLEKEMRPESEEVLRNPVDHYG